MIDFLETTINSIAVHYVGNKEEDEGFVASKKLMSIENDELTDLLHDYFLSSIKLEDVYQFEHHSNISMNEIYSYCKEIFIAPQTSLLEQSVNILKHIYAQSEGNPKIKSGEIYVVYFENCMIDDEMVDAIGIFKSENKHTYLTFDKKEDGVTIETQRGVNLQKLDKGAIIFNTYDDEGYRIVTSDMNATEGRYWRDDVLNIEELRDNVFHTKAYMSLCKDFVKKVYAKEVDKKEQSNFLNKAVNYFDTKATFDTLSFTEEVIKEPEHAILFKEHKMSFETAKDMVAEDDFNIHKTVVKSMRKKLRNLIKLDTQVEIRINPSPEENDLGERFVERGYDEDKKMYFYKVFFNKES